MYTFLRFRWLVFFLCCLIASTSMASNRLIHATSPYLLQHAHNPVDWYPWGTEALQKAKKEQKLIFLSIGYAACHWCHVMERESFTNAAVAAVLNAHYVSIKVDREERPDIDGHFMAILTALNGSGGWPLNMILTPELQPLYGGTYFPPEPALDKPGFKGLLITLNTLWQEDRPSLHQQMDELTVWLKKELSPPIPTSTPTDNKDPRGKAVDFWRDRMDETYGGVGKENKFPRPAILSLLLRHVANNRDTSEEADLALMTLDRMAAGGIHDQLGGAFHRYAVDRRWMIPHFEIMLYDNALLARVYLEAFQLTGRAQYAVIVREILDDLLGRFRTTGGCFISSLDADSEGKEGLFYTWNEEEIVAALGKEPAAAFMELYFDPLDGLVEGRSVLRLLGGLESLDSEQAAQQKNRAALLAVRAKRPSPARDDKVLTSWNSLTLSALARAGAVLGEQRYIEAAQTCLADLVRYSGADAPAKLRHSRRGQQLGSEVFLDDYAFLAQALLDLYEATFDIDLLQQARVWANALLDRFQPAPGQPFQLTPKGQTSVIPVRTELDDGVTPAGNSVALIVLHRLALLSEDRRFVQESEAIRQTLSGYLHKKAALSPELLHAWDYGSDSAIEVIIVGLAGHPGTQKLLQEVHRHFRSGLVLARLDPEQKVDAKAWPLLSGRSQFGNQPTAYVCRKGVCRLPVNRVEDLAQQLEEK